VRVRDRVEQSLVVVAHLPEGIPRFWLLDNNALETFVEDELQYGLQAAVEAKILTDVNGTSGIQTQAYATTVLATPVTGAYGHSMGSNYNKVTRPAVVFVADGDARLVVRRETLDDLLALDLG